MEAHGRQNSRTIIATTCSACEKEVVNDDITPERDLSLSTGLYSHEREDQEALHEAFPRTQMVSALVLPASPPQKTKKMVHKRMDSGMQRSVQPAVDTPAPSSLRSDSEQRPMKPLSKECDCCVPIWGVQQCVCHSSGEATAKSTPIQVHSLSKLPKVSEGGRMGAGGV